MSPSRLAAWIFALAVCTAWLASAAGVGRRPPSTRTVPNQERNPEMTALAADVQTQATRLRERLSRAPTPRGDSRNLFSFAPTARTAPLKTTPVVEAKPAPVAPAVVEPVLTLIGVAEMPGASGPVRTAMIAPSANELLMVTVGQTVIGRYEVITIGAEGVLLKDVATGLSRTLVLR